MKLAAIHGILLLIALAVAYQSWTRDEVAAMTPGSVVLWNARPADIEAIRYGSDDVEVRIEQREDDRGMYFWATVIRPAQPSAATAPSDSSATAASDSSAAVEPPRPDTIQFLVGQDGDLWLDQVARLTALRDLGQPDDEQRTDYELVEPAETLTVDIGGTPRRLIIGGAVFGTGDRYALDAGNGRVYVLPGRFVMTIHDGERLLMERRLHDFDEDDVGSVVLRTPRGERRMIRGEPDALSTGAWMAEGSDEPDQTFANFMSRLDGAWIVGYDPALDPDSLTSIVQVEYYSEGGRQMGRLEVLRGQGDDGAAEYFVETGMSRVPARIYETAGEQIAADVEGLF